MAFAVEPSRALYAVLMAGGSGTRFWPASRASRPKQLIRLSGPRTLIQQTYDRVQPLVGPERTLVVTGRAHARAVGQQLPDLPRRNVLVEPCGRNTAACAALAAGEVLARDPDGVIVLFPADHVIIDTDRWQRLVRAGWQLASERNAVVTFGLEPNRPETGFGYIKLGKDLSEAPVFGLHEVDEFVEKPVLERAKAFVASGQYLWNSGVFVLRAKRLLDLICEHVPQVGAAVGRLVKTGARGRAKLIADLYPALPAVSLDGGVMEKASGLVVLRASVGWSDVGSWSALNEVLPADERGNVMLGPALALDSSNCVLYSSGATIAALGVSDLVVVQTPDAILVCPKSRAQEVRDVVERLKQAKKDDLL